MKTLIDRDELYKALSQWDWQDLYLPVHFKEMVDELPAVDGGYTEQDVRDSYNDGFSMGVQRGYENAVLHYAKLALKQWIPCSERLPEDGKWCLFTDGENVSVERYKLDAIDHFFPNGRWFEFDDAVAWMPLPEPYEERREDDGSD